MKSGLPSSTSFCVWAQDVDLRQRVASADLEVVEVVRRRDLHRAGALLGIGIFVGDDGDAAADQRQDHMLADESLVALVVGMHGDGGIAEHGLWPRGGDDDVGRCIVGIEGAILQRIAQMPEVALHLDLLDFEVGDGGEQLRVPIDQALVLVDQPGAVELDEHLAHGAGQSLVHGEALARPVAGGAEPLQLIDDQAAGLVLPLPDALDEFLAAESRRFGSWRSINCRSTTIWVAMPA